MSVFSSRIKSKVSRISGSALIILIRLYALGPSSLMGVASKALGSYEGYFLRCQNQTSGPLLIRRQESIACPGTELPRPLVRHLARGSYEQKHSTDHPVPFSRFPHLACCLITKLLHQRVQIEWSQALDFYTHYNDGPLPPRVQRLPVMSWGECVDTRTSTLPHTSATTPLRWESDIRPLRTKLMSSIAAPTGSQRIYAVTSGAAASRAKRQVLSSP